MGKVRNDQEPVSARHERDARILMVGTLPPPVCGTTVSLQHLLTDLPRHDVDVTVIDTGGIRGSGLLGCWHLCVVVARLFRQSFNHDVVALHLNPYAVPLLGIIAYVGCRFSKARLLIRLFGGACFSEFHGIHGLLFRWVIDHCDIYLAQTKAQVDSAKALGVDHVRWYPTSRPIASNLCAIGKSCRRFLFVGWVCESKGISEIIRAGCQLKSDEIQIDVYGPFRNGANESDFDGQDVVRYRGVIPAGKAMDTIAEYDALLLPTHWEGEGYPGVILEAYQSGKPVITTRWRRIPEIVDISCGILITPGNADELLAAVETLAADNGLYAELQKGAREKAILFSTTVWTDFFVKCCRDLIS